MKTQAKIKEHPENNLEECSRQIPRSEISSTPAVKLHRLNTEYGKTEQIPFESEEGYRKTANNLQIETLEQERYRAIFESVNDGIVVVDNMGTIVDVNQKLRDIAGYKKEEIIGKKIEALARMIAKESLPLAMENFKRRMAGIDVPPYEIEIRKSNGELANVEIAASPLKYNGEIIGDMVILRDITQIKKMESTLRESGEKLQSCLDRAPDGVYFSDLKGTFLYGNKEAERIIGCRREELLGETFLHMKILQKKDLLRATRLLVLNSIGQNTGPDEFQLTRRDGTRVWVEINTTPVKHNGKTLVVGFARDITERKKALEALSESESKFKILAEESPNMIFIDKMGQLVYANKKCEAITGYKREELYSAGFDIFSLVAPEYREQIKADARNNGSSKEAKLQEFALLTKNGERIEAIFAAQKISYENQPATLGVVTNINNLRQAETLSAAILNNSPTGVYIVQDGRFKLVNPALRKIFAYSEGELLEKYSLDFVYPQDKNMVKENAVRMLKGKLSFPYEFRIVRKNEEIRWAVEQVASIQYGGKRAILGNILDITERKQAEAKLDETKKIYHALFEQSPDGIVIIDIETAEVIEFNDTACKQLGYSREEFAKLHMYDIDAMETRQEMRMHTSRILNQGIDNFITKHRTKQGEIRDIMIVGKPIDISGKKLSLSIHRDITENRLIATELRQSYEKLQRTLETTVGAIVAITETRDPYTAGHQVRVTKLACAIAEEMGLSEERIREIRTAGILHDIGKMYVPAEILSKPGALTEAEFMMIKNHPRVGYDIVKNIEFPAKVATMVLQHHERLNGSGYPHGLKDNEILLEARILAVADVVEAMSSHRPYRPSLGTAKALEEIEQNRGVLYDEKVVQACLAVFNDKGFKLED